jgi:hypothetical protein
VDLDHVTRDMSVAVYSSGVAGVVLREMASLAKPKSQHLPVGLVVLQLKPISPYW